MFGTCSLSLVNMGSLRQPKSENLAPPRSIETWARKPRSWGYSGIIGQSYGTHPGWTGEEGTRITNAAFSTELKQFLSPEQGCLFQVSAYAELSASSSSHPDAETMKEV